MVELPSGESRLYPIIGDPIIYVRSPQRLTSGFVARGQNCMCIPMQVPDGDLEVVMRGLTRTLNVDGLLITMPHKFTAFAYCATSSATARLFGVVSVIRVGTLTDTPLEIPLIVTVAASDAVIVCEPAVWKVAWKVPVPNVRVESIGSVARPSELVKCTVPAYPVAMLFEPS